MEFENKQRQVVPQKCPVCNAKQKELSMTPIGQSEDRMIMHVTCTKCDNALMVFVTQNDIGTMTFGVMVDVYSAEAQAIFDQKPVNDDDVISVHRYLQAGEVNIQDIVHS